MFELIISVLLFLAKAAIALVLVGAAAWVISFVVDPADTWDDMKHFYRWMFANWGKFLKRDKIRKIIKRSNVIQFDDMGYPLRLCIVDDEGKVDQVWLDTTERDGDVVLQWDKSKE